MQQNVTAEAVTLGFETVGLHSNTPSLEAEYLRYGNCRDCDAGGDQVRRNCLHRLNDSINIPRLAVGRHAVLLPSLRAQTPRSAELARRPANMRCIPHDYRRVLSWSGTGWVQSRSMVGTGYYNGNARKARLLVRGRLVHRVRGRSTVGKW